MKKHPSLLIILLISLLIALAGCGNEQPPKQPAAQQNEMTVEEFEKSAESTGKPTATQQQEIEVSAPAPQTTAAPAAPPPQEQKKEVTVYVTKTGSKYHQAGCRYLNKSQIPMSLSDAKDSGYEPCSRCNPPL